MQYLIHVYCCTELMASRIFTAFFLLAEITASAQLYNIDSLKRELLVAKDDTLRLILSGSISRKYREINPDSTYRYADIMLSMAVKLKLSLEESVALGEMGYALLNQGNYPRSLQTLLRAIAVAEDPVSEKNILPLHIPPSDEYHDRSLSPHLQRLAVLGKVQQYAAILYNNSMNYKKALSYCRTAVPNAKESTNIPTLIVNYITLGRTYMYLNDQDSALWSFQNAYENALRSSDRQYMGSILLNIGRVYLSMGKSETAKNYFKRALVKSRDNDYSRGVVASDLELAGLYRTMGKIDSSQYHIRHGLSVASALNAPDLRLRCYSALVEIYEKSNADSTVKYQSLIIQINKETFNAKQAQQFQNIDFDEQQRLNEIETATKEVQAQLRTNILLGSTFTLVVIAFFLYRNSRTKQKAKKNIERAYDQLKATQSQLIQSEKMASLGELTAGIAHEIQNPLNFVNNFSEINTELIDEMKEALSKGDYESAKSIASSIDENERKIVLHGKRADGIVKGMLQHSRTSSGVKESTDINALADEYLRLAYHGIRAKDKSFTATMHTDFDSTIGNINIIPQDIGRVILNLITNAFYAVTEKSKQQPDSQSAGRPGYEPTVIVSTRKMDGKLIIAVKDNGNGIPGHIKDKIFQPFFTTKPTGQGTGLGLSMSYEIVTKTYGGQLKVETKEGEFAEFIITLPIS